MPENQYELGGNTFTETEIKSYADSLNVPFDEYIKAYTLSTDTDDDKTVDVGKPIDTQKSAPPVVSNTESGVSSSVESSSESPTDPPSKIQPLELSVSDFQKGGDRTSSLVGMLNKKLNNFGYVANDNTWGPLPNLFDAVSTGRHGSITVHKIGAEDAEGDQQMSFTFDLPHYARDIDSEESKKILQAEIDRFNNWTKLWGDTYGVQSETQASQGIQLSFLNIGVRNNGSGEFYTPDFKLVNGANVKDFGSTSEDELSSGFGEEDYGVTEEGNPATLNQAYNWSELIMNTAAEVYANPIKTLREEFGDKVWERMTDLGGLDGDYQSWTDDEKALFNNIIYKRSIEKGEKGYYENGKFTAYTEEELEELNNQNLLKPSSGQENQPNAKNLLTALWNADKSQFINILGNHISSSNQFGNTSLYGLVPTRESFDGVINHGNTMIYQRQIYQHKKNLYLRMAEMDPQGDLKASKEYLEMNEALQYARLDEQTQQKVKVEQDIDGLEVQILALKASPIKNSTMIADLAKLEEERKTLIDKANRLGGQAWDENGFWNSNEAFSDEQKGLMNEKQSKAQARSLAMRAAAMEANANNPYIQTNPQALMRMYYQLGVAEGEYITNLGKSNHAYYLDKKYNSITIDGEEGWYKAMDRVKDYRINTLEKQTGFNNIKELAKYSPAWKRQLDWYLSDENAQFQLDQADNIKRMPGKSLGQKLKAYHDAGNPIYEVRPTAMLVNNEGVNTGELFPIVNGKITPPTFKPDKYTNWEVIAHGLTTSDDTWQNYAEHEWSKGLVQRYNGKREYKTVNGVEYTRLSLGSFEDLYNNGLNKIDETQGYFDSKNLSKVLGADRLREYQIWLEAKLENVAETKGYYNTAYIQKDPAKIEKSGWWENAGTWALAMAADSWGIASADRVMEILNTPRYQLDQIQKTVSDYNNSAIVRDNPYLRIDFRKDQLENFEVSLSEATSTAVGSFAPLALEFFALEMTPLAAIGNIRLAANAPKILQITARYGGKMLWEEAKMGLSSQGYVWGNGNFKPGTGSLFFATGGAIKGLGKFPGMVGATTRLGRHPLTKKLFTNGLAGAVTMDGTELIHAAWDDWQKNGDFAKVWNDMYGDFDESSKRILSNTFMFSIYGLTSYGSNARKGTLKDQLEYDFAFTQNQMVKVQNKLLDRQNSILNKYKNKPVDGEYKYPKKKVIDQSGIEREVYDTEAYHKQCIENLKKAAENKNPEALKDLDMFQVDLQMGKALQVNLDLLQRFNRLDPFVRSAKTGEILTEIVDGKKVKRLKDGYQDQLNKQIFKRVNNWMKNTSRDGKFKAVDVEYVNSDLNPAIRDRFSVDYNGVDMNNTAEFENLGNGQYKIIFDMAKYEPGISLHEINHIIKAEYVRRNPGLQGRMNQKLVADLGKIKLRGVGGRDKYGIREDITIKELYKRISESDQYKNKSEEEKQEELISYITQFLADPNVYAEQPILAGKLTNTVTSWIRRQAKSMGINTSDIQLNNAGDVIKVIGDFVMESKSGRGPSKISLDAMAKLNGISVIETIGFGIKSEANTAKLGDKSNIKASSEIVGMNSKIYEDIVNSRRNYSNEVPEAANIPLKDYVSQSHKDALAVNNMPLVYSLVKEYDAKVKASGGSWPEADKENVTGELMVELVRYTNRWDPAKDPHFGRYINGFLHKQMENALKRSGVLVPTDDGLKLRDVVEKTENQLGDDVTFEEVANRPLTEINTDVNAKEGVYEVEEKITAERVLGTDKVIKLQEDVVTALNNPNNPIPTNYKNVTPLATGVYELAGIPTNKVQLEDGSFNTKATRLKAGEQKSAIEWIESFNVTDKNGEITENTIWEIMPDGLDLSGISTGLQNKILKLFYDKGERVKTKATGSTAGGFTQTKKDLSPTEFMEIIKANPDVLPHLLYQVNKGITNSMMRSEMDEVVGTVSQDIQNIKSGASPRLAASIIEGLNDKGWSVSETEFLDALDVLLENPNITSKDEFYKDLDDLLFNDRSSRYEVIKTGQGFVKNLQNDKVTAPLVKNWKDFNRDKINKTYTKEQRAKDKQDYSDVFLNPLIREFLPKEIVDLKSSSGGDKGTFLPDFFKLISESRGVGNKHGEIGKTVQESLLNTKALKDMEKTHPELAKKWGEFLEYADKFEPANSQKLGKFQVGQIKKIIETGYNEDGSIRTREQKIAEIEKIIDLDVIRAARLFDNAMTTTLQTWLNSQGPVGSKERDAAAKYLWQHFKMNTNAVMSDRALAPFTSFYITDGPQTNVKWKGEHNKDSAANASAKFKYIYEGKWNDQAHYSVSRGYVQTLVPKAPLDFMDKQLGVNSTYGDQKFFVLDQLGFTTDYNTSGAWESNIYDFSTGRGVSYRQKMNVENARNYVAKLQKNGDFDKAGVILDYIANAILTGGEATHKQFDIAMENRTSYETVSKNNYNRAVDAFTEVVGGDRKAATEMFEGMSNSDYINSLSNLHKARAYSQLVAQDVNDPEIRREFKNEWRRLSYSAKKKYLNYSDFLKEKLTNEASIFDLDDNLLYTKSLIKYKINGKEHSLTPEEFNFRKEDLESQPGFEGWDFKEFDKVIEVGKGPAWQKFVSDYNRLGPEDTFIMTARAPGSKEAIHAYLANKGFKIPMENIVTTAGTEFTDGTYQGENKKGIEILNFYAGMYNGKRYNKVNFTDDHNNNVESVKFFAEQLGIDGSIYRTFVENDMALEMNNIISEEAIIGGQKISPTDYIDPNTAKAFGKNKGKYKLINRNSMKDWMGFIYSLAPKDPAKRKEFFKLVDKNIGFEYEKANKDLATSKYNLTQDYKALKKQFNTKENGYVHSKLKNKSDVLVYDIGGKKDYYSVQDAVRIYLWNQSGHFKDLISGKSDIQFGLTRDKLAEVNSFIEGDVNLNAYANQMMAITKGDGWSRPGEYWRSGSIGLDMIDLVNTVKREKYFTNWSNNVNAMFNHDVMNKIEAWKGSSFRDYMEQSISAQGKGTNVLESSSKITRSFNRFTQTSAATIMYYNTKSAMLQTISSINYSIDGYQSLGGRYEVDGKIIDIEAPSQNFNNFMAAGKAFLSTGTKDKATGEYLTRGYWGTFVDLWTNTQLNQRRSGNELNIEAKELTDRAQRGGAKAVISYLLEKGYSMTSYADAFAIASGGASYVYNAKKYLRENNPGLSEKEIDSIAKDAWWKATQSSQQSYRPDKTGGEQRAGVTKAMNQFNNTGLQYNRKMIEAAKDMKDASKRLNTPEGRSDFYNNFKKFGYYSTAQGLIFNFLQNAVWNDDIEDAEMEVLDKSLSGFLKGFGSVGQIINTGQKFTRQILEPFKEVRSEKTGKVIQNPAWRNLDDAAWTWLELFPGISADFYKLRSAAWTVDSKTERNKAQDKGFNPIDNPGYEASTKMIEATTKIPVNRIYKKLQNLYLAEQELELYGNWLTAMQYIMGFNERQVDPEGAEFRKEQDKLYYQDPTKRKRKSTSKNLNNQIKVKKNINKIPVVR